MKIATVSDFRRFVRSGPFAWPGGYDRFAVTNDGAVLCHRCCNTERRQIADAIGSKCDSGWWVVGAQLACDTDDFTACDHCGVILVDDATA